MHSYGQNQNFTTKKQVWTCWIFSTTMMQTSEIILHQRLSEVEQETVKGKKTQNRCRFSRDRGQLLRWGFHCCCWGVFVFSIERCCLSSYFFQRNAEGYLIKLTSFQVKQLGRFQKRRLRNISFIFQALFWSNAVYLLIYRKIFLMWSMSHILVQNLQVSYLKQTRHSA